MVEITYLAIIGIGFAAMFFGYGFGLFEGRSQGYKKRKAEENQEEPEKPAGNPATVTVDDPGLLRIKNENGQLTLDLDGTARKCLFIISGPAKTIDRNVESYATLAGGEACACPCDFDASLASTSPMPVPDTVRYPLQPRHLPPA